MVQIVLGKGLEVLADASLRAFAHVGSSLQSTFSPNLCIAGFFLFRVQLQCHLPKNTFPDAQFRATSLPSHDAITLIWLISVSEITWCGCLVVNISLPLRPASQESRHLVPGVHLCMPRAHRRWQVND